MNVHAYLDYIANTDGTPCMAALNIYPAIDEASPPRPDFLRSCSLAPMHLDTMREIQPGTIPCQFASAGGYGVVPVTGATDWHHDGEGTSGFFVTLAGHKTWRYAYPSARNRTEELRIMDDMAASPGFDEVSEISLGPGEGIWQPPGVIHSVITRETSIIFGWTPYTVENMAAHIQEYRQDEHQTGSSNVLVFDNLCWLMAVAAIKNPLQLSSREQAALAHIHDFLGPRLDVRTSSVAAYLGSPGERLHQLKNLLNRDEGMVVDAHRVVAPSTDSTNPGAVARKRVYKEVACNRCGVTFKRLENLQKHLAKKKRCNVVEQ